MNNIFEGSNPIEISKRWLAEAEKTEINDPNAMALASVDPHGMPNVRMVLLKEIESTGFVFYTNFQSAKAKEILSSGKAALVCLLYTSPSPRDGLLSRMPSSA